MDYCRKRAILSSVRSFVAQNKKIIICVSAIFAIGIIVGVISAINATNGNFERVARADMNFGAVKVFFFSTLALAACYGLLLVSGINNKTVFIAIIPFFALGFFCGEYTCALIARYEGLGLLNLLLIYLPFFIVSFVCMTLALCNILNSSCTDCAGDSTLKPSFVATLKIFGINIAINFVLFLIIGAIFGVIIVALY